MQSIRYGTGRSAVNTPEDDRSRYAPSSIYSGPGPAEEIPVHSQAQIYAQTALQKPFQEQQPRYNPLNQAHPRSSALLNMNDPVAMHLLMETAISDSRDYEILSFEEVENLKKERIFLRSRVDATRRKLALESKLKDAAQSLNRLYSTRGRPSGGSGGGGDSKLETPGSPVKSRRRSILGGKNSTPDPLTRADEEFASSSRKVQELTQELVQLERRFEECHRRIMEHTAGILQMTHRGLKKNLPRNDLPRSPESMASPRVRNTPRVDGVDDFDERSLYQVPEYITDLGHSPALSNGKSVQPPAQALDDMAKKLNGISQRMHAMIVHSGPQEHFDRPPHPEDDHIGGRRGAEIQAYLGYVSQGLDALEAAQQRNVAAVQQQLYDSEDQLEDVNVRLNEMLQRTNSVSKSPAMMQDEPRGKDIQSQLAFSITVLDRLNKRIETLAEQKDILTRQIQQQRELNTKSDAQRDAQIRDLTEELAETKRSHMHGEEEIQHSRNQIDLLMQRLDQAKQDSLLLEHQRGAGESRALEAEREARHEHESRLFADIQAKQHALEELQANMANMHNDFEQKTQHHIQQINALTQSREQRDLDLSNSRSENQRLEAELQHYSQQINALIDFREQAEQDLSTSRSEIERLESASQRHVQQINEHTNFREQTDLDLSTTRSAVERLESESQQYIQQIQALTESREQASLDLSNSRLEIERLESEVVRVSTEMTMVKAELDGAYGTRAQRAADVSMNPAIQGKIDELESKSAALQKELKETIEDYEVMTKQNIEAEKARDQYEEKIDFLEQRCETFEAQLNEEKIKWLGFRAGGGPAESTSTMVLKNEFKKMMRDTRAESMKVLKNEQEERRRLEGIIREMKKGSQNSTPAKNLGGKQNLSSEPLGSSPV